MSEQDYIRKAVELADGWSITGDNLHVPDTGGYFWRDGNISQPLKDALAAQLVRQARKLAPDVVMSVGFHGGVMVYRYSTDECWYSGEARGQGDKTLNTIKAIVDSEVLK